MTTLPMNDIEAGEQTALASDRIITSRMLVSSATATRWLDRNKRNRPISAIAVEKYRRDMLAGRWVYDASPIRFDQLGNLLDGQHRLTALAMCDDLTLPFLVVRGLPTETQMVMDQGRKRTAGSQLAIKGVRNAQNVASGTKVFLLWEGGYLFRDSRAASASVTTPTIEAWVEENADLVAQVCEYLQSLRNTDAPPSTTFAAAIAFHRIDPAMSKEFFHSLAAGGKPVGHPINTLDKRLQRIRRESQRLSTRDYLALLIQAWNAYRCGRKITQFLRPAGGSWTAANFPEPK